MFNMLEKIDWLNVIAGFLLGLTPLFVSFVHRTQLFLRDPARKKYIGLFWLYHWSLVDPENVREKNVEISFSLVEGKLRVRIPSDPVTGLAYQGELLKGQGAVRYLLLKGSGNNENILFVINDPLNPAFTVTNGVFASVDIKTTPTAGKVILSRGRLDLEQVKAYLQGRLFVRAAPLILSVDQS
jgi:hypothetical protein